MTRYIRRASLVAASTALLALSSAAASGETTAATGLGGPAGEARKISLFWKFPEDIRVNLHGHKLISRFPEEVVPMEGVLDQTQMVLAQLRDSKDVIVGAASQNVMPIPGHAKLKPSEERYNVAYSLILPGRGTLYAVCEELFPAEMLRTVELVRTTKKAWTGLINGRTTVGPRADGKCAINHGTGEFEGARGSFVKTHVINRIEPIEFFNGYKGVTRYDIELDKAR